MPAGLGKRKSSFSEEKRAQAEAALRCHFEARFSLPADLKVPTGRDEREKDDDSTPVADTGADEESEWGGVSSVDEEEDESSGALDKVEVVDHSVTKPAPEYSMMKRELKAYMSSRPPTAVLDGNAGRSKLRNADEEDDEDSAAHLANDMALQRLIAESHILSSAGANPAHYSSASVSFGDPNAVDVRKKLFAEGRTRRLTTDLRLRSVLGDKALAQTKQNKMPMKMRKGMAGAANAREEKRRREARENGIVLERPKDGTGAKTKAVGARRKKGGFSVHAPGVGKMHGAELRLSKRDIWSIEGSRERMFGPGAKGKRRR